MTLNYRTDDNGEVPKPNEAVGSSIPSREIVSLLDKKLAKWSSTSNVPKNKTKQNKPGTIGGFRTQFDPKLYN